MILKEHLGKDIIIFDGAMGTMLQSSGLKAGELPELLNIKESEKIIEIHRRYIDAGADIITTNTFGANELKLKDSGYTVEQVIDEAVKNARMASRNKKALIALDIGPIGELIEPLGKLQFERAYEIFKRQVLQGVSSGVDLIIIETMMDLYEAKAAVLAAKENSNLPVFCTMSFEKYGRTFTGCCLESMVMVLQGLGVEALGINCSLGPKDIEPLVDKILNISKVPVIVQANAGIPFIQDGRTVFKVPPQEFAFYGKKFAENGVAIIGGCCGTTDLHIRMVSDSLKGKAVKKRKVNQKSGVCTPTKTVYIDGIKVVGERINPTGKKKFKEALRNEDFDYVLKEAISQVESGAEILDVNVGLPEIKEEEVMFRVIKEIQSIVDAPLQIDSNNPKVIEKALRIYNGKAIVNSVTGEDIILEKVLPLVKKYGAAVIGLTLDENGIPRTAEERYKVAEKIIRRADEFGISREDVYIDCLTLTAAAQQEEIKETIRALSMIKEKLGVKTTLGISNVSFGMPNRELLNSTFLSAALAVGLDLPIINPVNETIMDTIKAFKVLWSEDKGGEDYISIYGNKESIQFETNGNQVSNEKLFKAILNGIKDEAKSAAEELLQTKNPMEIIDQCIVPILDFAGEKYEKGSIFLPQLIKASETVKVTLEILKERMKKNNENSLLEVKILLATVKGDIHDIGKNIVKVLLESYGIQVLDLGNDVPHEIIVQEVIKNDIKLVALSALMTTTVKNMEETIKNLREFCPNCSIIAGGAVLNKEYSEMIGADFYAKDARDAVKIARNFFYVS